MHYTRGSRHCEESLDKALEDLNAMLFFGSEIKLQQTDVRLVALDRRTYNTVAEIPNLHRVAASDVEAFLLRFAPGQAGAPGPATPPTAGNGVKGGTAGLPPAAGVTASEKTGVLEPAPSAIQAGQPVGRIQVVISSSNSFMATFSLPGSKEYKQAIALVYDHALDAWENSGWIRKPAGFRALKKQAGQNKVIVVCIGEDLYDLNEPGRAALQNKLNELVVRRQDAAKVPPKKDPVADQDVKPGLPRAAPPASGPLAPPIPEPAVKADITGELLRQAALLSPERRNTAAFDALELCMEANAGTKCILVENNYSLLSLSEEQIMGPRFSGFVLTISHHLAFCRNQMTVRCGLDHTLLENGKTGDTCNRPGHAFLGLSCHWEKDIRKTGGFTFVATESFLGEIPTSLRAALAKAGIAFKGAQEFTDEAGGSELIWPSSREDTLFYKTALGIRENYRGAAGADIFAIGNDAIKMNPGQVVFVGFRRTARHGIVYQAGDDFFARFDPDETEISAAGYAFAGSAGIIGFALDGSMKICAIFDPAQAKAGFAPPENKLIRFISAGDLERASREDAGLTSFGLLPPVVA